MKSPTSAQIGFVIDQTGKVTELISH